MQKELTKQPESELKRLESDSKETQKILDRIRASRLKPQPQLRIVPMRKPGSPY